VPSPERETILDREEPGPPARGAPQGRNARRLAGLKAARDLRKAGSRKAKRNRGPTSIADLEALPDDHPIVIGEHWTGVVEGQTPEQVSRLRRLREQFPRPWYVCAYRSEATPNVLRRAFGVDWSKSKDDRRPILHALGLTFNLVISSADMVGTSFGTVFFIPDPAARGGAEDRRGFLRNRVHHDADYRSVVAYVRARNQGTHVRNRRTRWERRKREKQLKERGITNTDYMHAVDLRDWLHNNWLDDSGL
jgi:hypothetical protein